MKRHHVESGIPTIEVARGAVCRQRPDRPERLQRPHRISFRVDPGQRGVLKQALVTAGFPAGDLAGYVAGEALEITLRECAGSGEEFVVRAYQRQAAESFYLAGSERGGSGVIVLPCSKDSQFFCHRSRPVREYRRGSVDHGR